jgi:hypothetical protein
MDMQRSENYLKSNEGETSSLEPLVRVTCFKKTTCEEKKEFLKEDRF